MIGKLTLDTKQGPILLRPEQPDDSEFLYALFRSHTLPGLSALPLTQDMKESLVGMQFTSQAATYYAQYPDARFDILQRANTPIGRTIIHETADVATIVDFALMPDSRGRGLGSATMAALVEWIGSRCRIIRCAVLFTNVASLAMCHRAGFVPVSQAMPHVNLEWHRP